MIKTITAILLFILLVSGCMSTKKQGNDNFYAESTFESATLENWQARGASRIEVSGALAHRGNYSLFVTGRNREEDGPLLDLTHNFTKGGQYKISGWVRLAEGEPVSEIRMSIQRTLQGVTRIDRIAGLLKIPDGIWFNLEAVYSLVSEVEQIGLSFEATKKNISFYIDDITIIQTGQADLSTAEKKMERDIPSLAEVYREYFTIGAAIEPYQLFGEEKELIKKHFNSITAENALKPEAIQPEEGVFTFEKADALLQFAEEHNLQVRGHTLVWHRAVPAWFFKGENGQKVSRETLIARMETHIKTLVGRYKGRISAWDVVNEAIEKYEVDDYYKSEWYNIIGPEYIELAFRFAHEADPAAKLFLNDYDVFDLQKGQKIYNLAKRLLDKGVPLHGIGMQFHLTISRPGITALQTAIAMFSQLGLEIHITELDMNVYQSDQQPDFEIVPGEILIRQGHRYREIFEVLKANSDAIGNVTFWGFQDDDSYLTRNPANHANAPLLFDKTLKAKYAFWGIADPARLPPDVILNLTQKEADKAEAPRGTPLIDGLEDEVWAKAGIIYTEIFIIRSSGAQAAVKLLWDEENLYVLARVRDTNLRKASRNAWEQDSFEIFIDENNHKTIDYERDDAQYRINFENEQTFGGFPGTLISATTRVDDGYIVEAAIPFQSITPAVGMQIGLDLQVNDDQGSGSRDSAVKWNDPTNEGYRNTSGFGILTLVE